MPICNYQRAPLTKERKVDIGKQQSGSEESKIVSVRKQEANKEI